MASSTDELVRLILSVDGSDAVSAALNQTNADLAALKNGFADGSISIEQFIKEGAKLEARAGNLGTLWAGLVDAQTSVDVSFDQLSDAAVKLVMDLAAIADAENAAQAATRSAAEAWAIEAHAAIDAEVAIKRAAEAEFDASLAAVQLATAQKQAAEAARLQAIADEDLLKTTYEIADAYALEAHAADNVVAVKGKVIDRTAEAAAQEAKDTIEMRANISAYGDLVQVTDRQSEMLEGLTTKQRMRAVGVLASMDAEKQYGGVINAGAAYSRGAASASREAAEASRQGAYRLQMLGNTIDDLQYVPQMGLRPIINNIMMFSPQIGIALVAFEVLRKAIASWIGETEKAGDVTEKLKKKLETLQEKPVKLSVDFKEINQLEDRIRILEERKAVLNATAKGTAQEEFEKKAKDVINDQGGGSKTLSESVYKAMGGTQYAIGNLSDADRRKLATLKKNFGATDNAIERENIKGEIDALLAPAKQAMIQEVKDIVADFGRGDKQAIGRVKGLAAARPDAFGQTGSSGESAADAIGVMPSSAAENRQRDEAKKRGEAAAKLGKHIADAENKIREADKKLTDELNKQGFEATDDWKKEGDKAFRAREDARVKKGNGTGSPEAKAKVLGDLSAQQKAKAELAVNPHKQVEQAATQYATQAFRNEGATLLQAQLAAAQAVKLSMEQNIPLQQAIVATYQNIARLQAQANNQIRQMQPQFAGPWN